MREVIVTMWTSLDGFVAGPDDELDWVRLDEQMMVYEQALVDAADILMLGRITFGDFAGHWPLVAKAPATGNASSLDAMLRRYALRLDAMRKVVVSGSGRVADWCNSETLPAIDEATIARLEYGAAGPVVIYGSRSVVNALSRLHLVDEYHLLQHPTVLGEGRPLFDSPVRLALKSVEPFQSGVVLAKYRAG
jgi:dihydrofolate reductase